MRTHMILPDDLVERIDSLVGKRKRSRFVEEAVREKLRQQALLVALEATAGKLSAEEHPEWATSEDVVAWVRESRRQSDRRLEGL